MLRVRACGSDFVPCVPWWAAVLCGVCAGDFAMTPDDLEARNAQLREALADRVEYTTDDGATWHCDLCGMVWAGDVPAHSSECILADES